jgi:hypothetical protein
MSMLSSGRDGRPTQTDRLRAAGIATIVVLVLAGAAAQFLNYGLDLRVEVLDASGDGGAFGLVGQLAAASAALAAWSVLSRVRGWDVATAVLPLLLTFLAVDKALRLHDDISRWRLYYAPLLLATFIALVMAARRLPAPSPRLMRHALLMLSVAFLIHLTAKPVLHRLGVVQDSWTSQITGMAKHGAEVAGWLLVTLALTLGRRDLHMSGQRNAE